MKRIRRSVRILLVVSCTVSLQGCGDKTLQRLSAELASSATGCTEEVEKFYAKMNEVHHHMDEEELRLRTVEELKGIDLPVPGKFTAKFDRDKVIRPRTRMVKLLEVYCVNLDTVINARRPDQADETVRLLNKASATIGGELVNKVSAALPTGAIVTLTEPVKTLASLSLRGAFSILRDNWAMDTIYKKTGAIDDVCKNVARDLNNTAEGARERAENIVHLKKIVLERKVKKGIHGEETDNLLSSLTEAGKFADSVTEGNPAPTFEKISEVTKQLEHWAEGRKEKQPKLRFLHR